MTALDGSARFLDSGKNYNGMERAGADWWYMYPLRSQSMSPNCEQGKHGFCDGTLTADGEGRCTCKGCTHTGTGVRLAQVLPSYCDQRVTAAGMRTAAQRARDAYQEGRVAPSKAREAMQGWAGRGRTRDARRVAAETSFTPTTTPRAGSSGKRHVNQGRNTVHKL